MSFQNNGAAGRSDLFSLDGTADMAGTVDVTFDVGNDPGIGPGTSTILTAGNGVSAATRDNLIVTPSVVANYSLAYPDANDIVLGYDVAFDGEVALGATRSNQNDLTASLQGLFENGQLSRSDANRLIAISDPDDYRDATDSLSGEIYADNQLGALYANLRFGEALLSCAERTGTYRFINEGQCGWLLIGGSSMSQRSNDHSRGFDASDFAIAGGAQFALDDDWSLGGGIAYVNRDTTIDGLASSTGDQVLIGGVAKRERGPALISAALAAGYGSFDTRRDIFNGDTARGDQDLWTVSGRVRGSWLFEREAWYFKPMLDLGVDYVSASSLNERGAGSFNHEVDSHSETYFHVRPAIEIGGEFGEGEMIYRPKGTIGITQFLGSGSPTASSSFQASVPGVPGFEATSQFDETYFDIAAGIEILSNENTVVSIDGFSFFSENTEGFGGSVRVSFAF